MRIAAAGADLGSKGRRSVLKPPKPQKSLQSCPTLCNPMDCSLPGSSVHGTLQARTLEWLAISSSRGSSRPRDWTLVSYVSCTGGWLLDHTGAIEFKVLAETSHHISWNRAAWSFSNPMVMWYFTNTKGGGFITKQIFTFLSVFIKSSHKNTVHTSKLMCHSLLSDKNLILFHTCYQLFKNSILNYLRGSCSGLMGCSPQ